jgi:hypothetical protein
MRTVVVNSCQTIHFLTIGSRIYSAKKGKSLTRFLIANIFNGLLSGVLVLTQYLNWKYCVSSQSHPLDERHTMGWACYNTDHMILM